MALAHTDPVVLLAAVAVTSTATISAADTHRRHKIGIATVGGSWTVVAQWSPDSGSTWINASDTITVNSSTDTLYVADLAPTGRILATRTGGTLSAWVVSTDDQPMGRGY